MRLNQIKEQEHPQLNRLSGIRCAIISSKQLLDEVFGDRKVIATIDLPSHLAAISSQLIGTGRFDVQQLIYDHTMFPVYAPFIDESIRVRAMGRMANCSKGAVHLMLGASASIVKTSDIFRICPICIAEQEKKYGESYWSRLWYLPSLPYCPEHGPLNQSSLSYHDNRHTFHACSRTQSRSAQYNDNRKTEQ
ncbi:TniQ family protein [Morganella psychrotolerans]|uniref:TniQ family protein n=1 Tax=Morganella psychrotolerans TaxID=368603 RepID=UPI00192E34CF